MLPHQVGVGFGCLELVQVSYSHTYYEFMCATQQHFMTIVCACRGLYVEVRFAQQALSPLVCCFHLHVVLFRVALIC